MFRIVTGVVVIIVGLVLVYFGFQEAKFLAIYGIGISIVGIVIIFNKHEDEIEEIKNDKEQKL